MPFIIIGIVIVLAIVIWVISTINSFTRREIKIEEARSGIEVALTKRYDMERCTFSFAAWTCLK